MRVGTRSRVMHHSLPSLTEAVAKRSTPVYGNLRSPYTGFWLGRNPTVAWLRRVMMLRCPRARGLPVSCPRNHHHAPGNGAECVWRLGVRGARASRQGLLLLAGRTHE